MSAQPTKAVLAARAWRAMFDLLMRSAPGRTRGLARFGLTPNDARAMSSLDVREGRTMRSLAEQWACDASNATWMVDRLEKLGLAERRSVPEDRRVRHVVLTAKGAQVHAALREQFYTPPPELTMLERDDLDALVRLLAKLPAASEKAPAPRPAAPVRASRPARRGVSR